MRIIALTKEEAEVNMEQILEMNESHQLTIPEDFVRALGLEPGAHFAARLEGGQLTIERVPFSSLHQGDIVQKTIESLQDTPKSI